MPQVDPVSTPAGIPAQAEALVAAWRIALGRDPPLSLVELNLAQLALENDNGKALWNNNPGNLTTGNDANDYYILSQAQHGQPGPPRQILTARAVSLSSFERSPIFPRACSLT